MIKKIIKFVEGSRNYMKDFLGKKTLTLGVN